MSWKYECLFQREMTGEPDLTSWWKNEKSGIPVGRMGYRRRTTVAGPRMECEIYPVFGRDEAERVRAARRNITPEKQKRLPDIFGECPEGKIPMFSGLDFMAGYIKAFLKQRREEGKA